MKNVLTPLAKSGLTLLGLTAAVLATDTAIQKKIYSSRIYGWGTTALIISNKELEDLIKIATSLKKPGLQTIKGFNETIENEATEQKGGFLGMLLDTLVASLLENMLAGKGVIQAGEGHF